MKKFFKLSVAFTIIAVMIAAIPLQVSAREPYMTFTMHNEYGFIPTQTVYEPVMTITKIDGLSMSQPSDLRMGADGNLYIADTGNKRIIVSTKDGELVRIIGEGELKTPRGVYVDDYGDVYVADEDAQKVIVYTREGVFKNEYGKPDHPLFGKYASFKPTKVAVDKRGNMYIISKGNTNGIIQISPSMGGEFLGYFGANQTNPSLMTIFRSMFYSEDSLSRLADVVPITTTNLDIDEKGLVFTVSQGDDSTTLKKLNVAGRNILGQAYSDSHPAAVTTSDTGNIYVASRNGLIYEYNSEGDLVFLFGGYDDGQQRTGLFTAISGLVIDNENRIYALDEQKNSIEIFAETEFAKTIHTGFAYLDSGRYIESEEPWTTVVEMNSMFAFANIGLGEAKYRQAMFDDALKYFRLGGDTAGYSDAFWEIRSNWLKDNMGIIIVVCLLLIVLSVTLKRLDKKYAILGPVKTVKKKVANVKFISSCLYTFYSLKNPNDTAYGIKKEKRTGNISSLIMLVLFFILSEITLYTSGFLFKSGPDGYYDILGDAVKFFGIFALGLICCYLVCTITEGEASFAQLFQGIICSLAPMLIAQPVILIMSNVLTLNEKFFIDFINIAGIGWSVLLIFLAIKNLNDYTFAKTIATVLLTIFVALITVALLFVIYVLISQVIEFASAITGEVVYKLV